LSVIQASEKRNSLEGDILTINISNAHRLRTSQLLPRLCGEYNYGTVFVLEARLCVSNNATLHEENRRVNASFVVSLDEVGNGYRLGRCYR
jgi:hypothetical protein